MQTLFARTLALVLLVSVLLVGFHQGVAAALLTAAAMGSALSHLSRPAHLLGVNQLGSLSSAMIVQRALALTFTKRPLLKRFSLDLTKEEMANPKLNQVVTSRIKTVPAVTDFGQIPQDVVTTDVNVTIDRFKQILLSFTPQQLASTDRELINEQAEPMAVGIANYLVDDAASLFTDANYATPDDQVNSRKTVTTVANTGYSTLTAIRRKLIERGAPEGFKKFGMVNAAVYEKLLNDPLCNRGAKATGADPIATGELPDVAGFEAISEFPTLPGTDNMVGAFGTPDAIVLASRLPKDPRSVLPNVAVPFNLTVVQDPGSGFAVMLQEWIGTDLSVNVRMCFMHGRAVGNKNNLQRQVTA